MSKDDDMLYDKLESTKESIIEEVKEDGARQFVTGALDIRYRTSGTLDYLGADICVTFGGPNIWLDTSKGVLKGTWGLTGEDTVHVDREVCDQIDDYCNELFDIQKEVA